MSLHDRWYEDTEKMLHPAQATAMLSQVEQALGSNASETTNEKR